MGEVGQLIGQVLHDTYRVERLLGEGGMGAVYEASHLRLARRFAVKVLFPAVASNPEALARFKREATITSELHHPHIVEVIDFYHMSDGTPYLVMELLEGQDLATRIQRTGRLELLEVASILRQAASGLQAAHQHGIVHRDLKPQNIFLCRRGERDNFVKVVDFGISKVLGSQSAMTRTGALMGTPFYMAPEQAEQRASEVDLRTDVYAMGVILHEMLAGQVPFSADSIPSLLYLIVHKDPPALQSLRPDVPESIERVIQKAMRKRPDDRYQSMGVLSREFISALEVRDFDEPTEDRKTRWTKPEVPVVGDGARDSAVAPTVGAGLEAEPTEAWKPGGEHQQEEEFRCFIPERPAGARGPEFPTEELKADKEQPLAGLLAGNRPVDVLSTTGAPIPLVRRKDPTAPKLSPGPVGGMSTTLSSSVGEVRKPRRPRLSARAIVAIAALAFAAAGTGVLVGALEKSKQPKGEPVTAPKSHASKPSAVAKTARPDARTKNTEVPPPVPDSRVAPTRQLWVTTTPPGAEVLLDGERVGRTPLLGHPIPTHKATLVVRKQGHAEFRQPLEPGTKRVTLKVALKRLRRPDPALIQVHDPDAKKTTPHRESTCELDVFTLSAGAPMWADIYVDGKKIGPSPVFLKQLKPGPHTVEARREGHRSRPRQVMLQPGQKQKILMELETQ